MTASHAWQHVRYCEAIGAAIPGGRSVTAFEICDKCGGQRLLDVAADGSWVNPVSERPCRERGDAAG